MPNPRPLLFLLLPVLTLSLACGDGDSDAPEATVTPLPLPPSVSFADAPAGDYTLSDPEFEALPGATAHYGELGGSIFQIEIPDDWNGRLVLYMHGFHNFAPTLSIDQPGIRRYLIRNGFAWGASSFSDNSLVPGLGADETAALWDYFAREFGRPQYTYVTGHSMGGGGTVLAAERYPERFDGGLALCGIAGNTSEIAFFGDFFVAASFAAGVAPDEFDPATTGDLIATRIEPALEDPETLDTFIDIVTDLTGGPRAFVREGTLEQLGTTALGAGLFGNRDTAYELGPQSDVPEEEFNASVIRLEAGDFLQSFSAGSDSTGDVQIPLLTMHTTGDLFAPVSETQLVAERIATAGKSDLLVQRAVQAPGHCTFTGAEWEQGLEDLIAWVEEGERPEGEELLTEDLSDAGADFTLAPRLGSPEADDVPGASERIELSGTLTLDGESFEGFLAGVVVRKDGFERSCNFRSFSNVGDGRYRATVASATEVRGCGETGAKFYLFAFHEGRFFSSAELASWPEEGTTLAFDASFSSAEPQSASLPVTTFEGAILDASGDRVQPSTEIQAYVAETLCGISSVPQVVMGASDPGSYFLIVAGPEARSDCSAGADITFRIDGETALETAINDVRDDPHELDLTLP